MVVKQLILDCGNYTVYSADIWHDLETCPGFDPLSASKALSSGQLSGIIGGSVLFVIIICCLAALFLVFKKKMLFFPKHFNDEAMKAKAKNSADCPE
jgi:hypothetical protein